MRFPDASSKDLPNLPKEKQRTLDQACNRLRSEARILCGAEPQARCPQGGHSEPQRRSLYRLQQRGPAVLCA